MQKKIDSRTDRQHLYLEGLLGCRSPKDETSFSLQRPARIIIRKIAKLERPNDLEIPACMRAFPIWSVAKSLEKRDCSDRECCCNIGLHTFLVHGWSHLHDTKQARCFFVNRISYFEFLLRPQGVREIF